jgi:hypothetical protein
MEAMSAEPASFSDAESSGSAEFGDSGDSSTEQECVCAAARMQTNGNDSGHDEAWLRDMIGVVEVFLTRPTTGTPPTVFQKWKAISNLLLVYHQGMRDTVSELENETRQLQATQQLLAHVTQEQVRLQEFYNAVSDMTAKELEKWELVGSDSESET